MHKEAMPLLEANAADWWSGLQRGEEKALHNLYHLFRDDLFSYARRITGQEESARNGIQELFVRLWNNRQTLGEARSVKAYLLSTLRRILMAEIKNGRNQYSLPQAYVEGDTFKDFSAEDIVILDEESRLKQEFVASILNSLTPKQREIVYLKYYEELSISEIADMLNINYQSVINHLQRAFLKVRSQITPEQQATLFSTAGLLAILAFCS